MNPGDYPTKYNLIKTRRELHIAKQGYDLMDAKRRTLLAELKNAKKNLYAISVQAGRAVEAAFAALAAAHTEMGAEAAERYRHTHDFPLTDTTASLNEASLAWREAKKLLKAYAAAQEKTNTLTQSLRKTQKKAAALNKITIPNRENQIKQIESQLEEQAREEAWGVGRGELGVRS
jgi:V/A-type H+-transporting ATPase subunit D